MTPLNQLHLVESRRSLFSVLCRSWRFIAPFKWHMACLCFVLLLSIPLTLLTPLPLTLAVDSVVGTRPLPPFLQAWIPPDVRSSTSGLMIVVSAAYIGIALCMHLQAMVLWILSSYTGERLIYAFRSRLFEHLQRICSSYHEAQGPTDSVYPVSSMTLHR